MKQRHFCVLGGVNIKHVNIYNYILYFVESKILLDFVAVFQGTRVSDRIYA